MASKNQKVSYFNTLVFTVVTGIVCLALLALLFFDIGKEFMYFIIALEVGAFAVIGYCITKIVLYERQRAKYAADGVYVVKFDTCPDYYVKRMVDGKTYCFNDYTIKDKFGKNYVMKVYPESVDGVAIQPPDRITISNTVRPDDYLFEKFDLNALESDPNLKGYGEKCKMVYSVPADKKKQYSHLPWIPWTHASSRCQSFVENST